MPRKNINVSNDPDKYELGFVAALNRLIDNKPTNDKLAIKARENKLKINPANVALESGFARSKLYKCASILKLIESHSSANKTLTELAKTKKTETDTAILMERLHLSLSISAAALIECYNLRKEKSALNGQIQRLTKEVREANKLAVIKPNP